MKEFLVAYVFRAPMPIAIGVKVDPPLTIPFANSMVLARASRSDDEFLAAVRKHLVDSGVEPTDLKLLAVTELLTPVINDLRKKAGLKEVPVEPEDKKAEARHSGAIADGSAAGSDA